MPWKDLHIMDQLVLSNAKDLARNLVCVFCKL